MRSNIRQYYNQNKVLFKTILVIFVIIMSSCKSTTKEPLSENPIIKMEIRNNKIMYWSNFDIEVEKDGSLTLYKKQNPKWVRKVAALILWKEIASENPNLEPPFSLEKLTVAAKEHAEEHTFKRKYYKDK